MAWAPRRLVSFSSRVGTTAMAARAITSLTLRFDGSLRSAAPPAKRRAIYNKAADAHAVAPPFPLPSSSLASSSASEPTACVVAACAASLHWDDDGSEDEGGSSPRMLALAGKLLSLGPSENEVTEAVHAEYEGLLLGLSVLNDFVASENARATEAPPSPTQPLDVLDEIRIQGDCRSVLHHIRGSSLPEGLEAHRSRAQSLLSSIEGHLKIGSNKSPVIVVDHIPREDNTVCDDLASRIVRRQRGVVARELWSDIESYPRRRDAPATLSIEELLRSVPRLVPASLRPTFYGKLAEAAWDSADYPDLVRVGRELERHTKLAISAARRSRGPDAAAKKRRLAERHALSVALQLAGWARTSTSNPAADATPVRRRHRYLLEAHLEVARAVEGVVADAESGSMSDVLHRWIDLSPRQLEQDPTFHPPGIGGDVEEWMRRAYPSKEWDEGRSYVLWFQ